MSFFDNTRKPDGLGGKLMVSLMNVGHRSLAHWGMQFLPLSPDARVLDLCTGSGCIIISVFSNGYDSYCSRR